MVDFHIAATIATLAPDLARGLVNQGWDGTGDAYHLHACPGDAQAFDDAIGRESTLSERIALEQAIRIEIGRLCEEAS